MHEKNSGKRINIPYRNSLITSILRDSIGGNCKTVLIANMSSNELNEEETLSTARFA